MLEEGWELAKGMRVLFRTFSEFQTVQRNPSYVLENNSLIILLFIKESSLYYLEVQSITFYLSAFDVFLKLLI